MLLCCVRKSGVECGVLTVECGLVLVLVLTADYGLCLCHSGSMGVVALSLSLTRTRTMSRIVLLQLYRLEIHQQYNALHFPGNVFSLKEIDRTELKCSSN